MTLSDRVRLNAIDTALRRMREDLGDHWIVAVRFVVDSEHYADLPKTTWSELQERMLVTGKHNFGEEAYCFTGAGLIAAMKLTGEFDSKGHNDKCILLRKALKDLVKGRDLPYGRADVFELVAKTGLTEHWIFNAIDARFLAHAWPQQYVEVEWRNREVRVSRQFGQRRLDGLDAGPIQLISNWRRED